MRTKLSANAEVIYTSEIGKKLKFLLIFQNRRNLRSNKTLSFAIADNSSMCQAEEKGRFAKLALIIESNNNRTYNRYGIEISKHITENQWNSVWSI